MFLPVARALRNADIYRMANEQYMARDVRSDHRSIEKGDLVPL